MTGQFFILTIFCLASGYYSSQIYPSNFLWNGCKYTFDGYRSADTIKCSSSSYNLVFEDDFDSTGLNTDKWQTSYPWGRSLKNDKNETGWEKQYYSDENVSVKNGYLFLHTKVDPGNRSPDVGVGNVFFNYTSGMVFSRQKFGKGKYEVRAKIPPIAGLWPAFWMFGFCFQEIDVFEFTNESETSNAGSDAGRQIMTYHKQFSCSLPDDGICHKGLTKDHQKDLSADFHIYSMEWNDYKITWRLDGVVAREVYRLWMISGPEPGGSSFGYAFPIKECSELAPSTNYTTIEPFITPDHPMYLILNTAVLLDRAAEPGALPQDFIIDYVRAYVEVEGNIGQNTNKLQELGIYPNPTQGNLLVSSKVFGSQISEIIVFDELGRAIDVRQRADGRTFTLDFFMQAKGIYFLKIVADNGTYFRKIIRY